MKAQGIRSRLLMACIGTLVVGILATFAFQNPARRTLQPENETYISEQAHTSEFSHDGRFIAIGTTGGRSQRFKSRFRILNADTLTPAGPEIDTLQWASILKPVKHPNGFLVALSNDPGLTPRQPRPETGRIVQFPTTGGERQIVAGIQNPITSMALSRDEQRLAVCSGPTKEAPSTCRVYSFPERKLLATFRPTQNGQLHAEFPADSKRCLIICSRPEIYRDIPDTEKSVRAFLISTEDASVTDEHVIDRRDLIVYGVAPSKVDNAIVVSSEWWVGQCTIQGDEIEFKSIRDGDGLFFAYHPGRNIVAKGGVFERSAANSYIDFTDLATGELLDRCIHTSTEVSGLAFSTDGQWLVTIGYDTEKQTSLLEKYDLHNLK